MYRIVEDDLPPIPDACSEDMRDFLMQCFKKNPVDRPRAEMLFEHPWLKQTLGEARVSVPRLARGCYLSETWADALKITCLITGIAPSGQYPLSAPRDCALRCRPIALKYGESSAFVAADAGVSSRIEVAVALSVTHLTQF
jgi:serine/threonine protein kinase